ncbi:hypothetical protein PTKIN_Ptkin14bG0204600 [Pterospermum kingtungense]
MAEALVGAVIEHLIAVARQKAVEEVRLVLGFDKAVQKLTYNLQDLKFVLEDAESREVKPREIAVKNWLDRLREASYDMEDILDEWNTAILKSEALNSSSRNPVCCSFPFSCFPFDRLVVNREIAVKIRDVNERVDEITREKDKFQFKLSRGSEVVIRREITTSFMDVPEVCGRDQERKKIVNKLKEHSEKGLSLQIISVVGMGGIGKTTLAKLVHNDDQVVELFHNRIWVCVSEPFDVTRIAKEILESLTGSAVNFDGLDTILQHIRKSLLGKNFFLVLDDVWTEQPRNWQQLANSLNSVSPKSTVLVTTRNDRVAESLGTTFLCPLGILGGRETFSLFSHFALSNKSEEERERLEAIGQQIADKCKGLPLAAKTLGSMLHFKRSREEWQHVLDSDMWELENIDDPERGLFPPLLLSYYDLSSPLRRCFSYSATFPKDWVINKEHLIRMWMAHDYLSFERNKEMELTGEECFESLVARSFFQDFERNKDGKIVACKMHDIVHDFAQYLLNHECVILKTDAANEPRIKLEFVKVRHSFMVLVRNSRFPSSIYGMTKLRGLQIESRNTNGLVMDLALPRICNQLTCLRSLGLSEGSFGELPEVIGKLIHLRYLRLKNNRELRELPDTLCKLCNLQTLDLSWCSNLRRLPNSIGSLINLRHLDNKETRRLKFFPRGIGRLTCLRTLNKFVVSCGGDHVEGSTVANLENLNSVQGFLEIRKLGDVRDVEEAKRAGLQNKRDLVGLNLCFGREDEEDNRTGNTDDISVLEALQPPAALESLGIEDYGGITIFPQWILSLKNLKNIKLANCRNCEDLPPLGKLLFLESLHISNMCKVTKVGLEFVGVERGRGHRAATNTEEGQTSSSSTSAIAFPKLIHLTFEDMEAWEHWKYYIPAASTGEKTIQVMPRLQSLTLQYSPRLRSLPDHLLEGETQRTLEQSPETSNSHHLYWQSAKSLQSWSGELRWAVGKLKGKALRSMILRLSWRACIYHLWRERNARIYTQVSHTPSQVAEKIREDVALKIAGLKKIADGEVNRRLSHN